MHSSKHGPLVVVYKVDYFIKESLLSSLVLLNTRVVLLSDFSVMGRLGHEQFLFYFLLFSDFIGILFSFSFLFFVDDEEARDIAVT